MTTAQDQQSRAEFEVWARSMGFAAARTRPTDAAYNDSSSHIMWEAWKAARALPAPENVREGEPYDNPAFEDLARTMGVLGTAQAALCAQFFLAGRGAVPATSSVSNARSGAQWKCGNEFLPYHPSASHVEPAYRDGWNACFKAAAQVLAMGRVPPGWQAAPLEATEKMIRASDAVDFTRLDTDGVTRAVYESMLAAAPRPPAAQEGA